MKRAMKKLSILLLTAVALGTAPQVSYGFGLGGLTGGGGDLNGFLKSADDAEILMRQSSWHLADALLAKGKLTELQDKRAAIEKVTDPQEKSAKLRELDKEVSTELSKVDYAAKSKEMEKEADKKKKEKTAAGVYNFALGALKDGELVVQGQKLATTVPSPSNATQLPRIKNFVASVTAQADSVGKVVSGLKQLTASVGLKALPTKSSEPPKAITD